jgi:hypothetical protein
MASDKVKIDREGFKNACVKHTGMPFIQMLQDDIDKCAREFGLQIYMYFRNYLECIILDHEKLFLSRIKYGF